jgi:hypothetical protein
LINLYYSRIVFGKPYACARSFSVGARRPKDSRLTIHHSPFTIHHHEKAPPPK